MKLGGKNQESSVLEPNLRKSFKKRRQPHVTKATDSSSKMRNTVNL